MTTEEALRDLRSEIGESWPKCKPIPNHLLLRLCDSVWENGGNPSTVSIRRLLGVSWDAVRFGVMEWRRSKNLPKVFKPRIPAVNVMTSELRAVLSAEIQEARHTCFDSANDGRWETPHVKVLRSLLQIKNQSLRDSMALYAAIRADAPMATSYYAILALSRILSNVMPQLALTEVADINPDDVLFRIYRRELGNGLSQSLSSQVFTYWHRVRRAFDEYAEKLSETERVALSRFFIRPVGDRLKMSRTRHWAARHEECQARIKGKTEAVHAQFYRLRFIAKTRLNQARRLHQAFQATIQQVEQHAIQLPHDFSYDEEVPTENGRNRTQRVHLTLWDSRSLFDRAVTHGYKASYDSKRQRRECFGKFAASERRYEIEYRFTESTNQRIEAESFWFLELYDSDVFFHTEDPASVLARQEFNRDHGYETPGIWPTAPGMLSFGSASRFELLFLRRAAGHRFIPALGIYAACLFANLVIRMMTVTGARLGEVQQIAQSPNCVKKLENIGPKSTARWLLRMVPKGRTELAEYYIDEDTKNDLVELVRFLLERYKRKELPVLPPERARRIPPDRFVLQWDGCSLKQNTLNTLIRFLLHRVIVDPAAGKGIHITSHLLRHAFATEMAELRVSVDVIARMLNQRDHSVTKYYSRPTNKHVMEAAELIFADRVDVAEEALRSPAEIGRMLKDAEGQVGALTDVLGGTCVVGNMCPAKFACIGCAGNAPDPAKRSQVERKLSWATQQMSWAASERLFAEERQMRQLVQDCKLMLAEMDLIEKGRADCSQLVKLVHITVAENK